MCLAVPARVCTLESGERALVELGGIRRSISVALTPEVRVGDYVIVHVGYAIGVLDTEEAEQTLALLAATDAPEEASR
jgi:hydrogenase expression/formation protein HypC